MKEVTDQKINRYFDVTGRALKKVKINPKAKLPDSKKIAEDFLDMATRYYEDAKYFQSKGDYVNTLAALSYAHAWLDAGARIGVFDVDHDSELFTVD
jgi:hypothetical protein